MLQTSWLEVDLGRLDSNLRLFRRLVGDGVKICGVIKADAYSLGAVPLASRLEAGGIDSLGCLFSCPGGRNLQRRTEDPADHLVAGAAAR